MASSARLLEERSEPREEVHHRTRATRADGTSAEFVVVNISACGLMARAEGDFQVGERIRVRLPAVGQVAAEVRWSLGGRVGCQLDQMIPLAEYFQLLAVIARS